MEEPIFGPVSKKAGMEKEAYAKTVDGVIQEFDQFAASEVLAQTFVNRLSHSWWGVIGPKGAYLAVEIEDWDRVMNHAKTRFPKIKLPKWFDSIPHRLGLNGSNPDGRKYDAR